MANNHSLRELDDDPGMLKNTSGQCDSRLSPSWILSFSEAIKFLSASALITQTLRIYYPKKKFKNMYPRERDKDWRKRRRLFGCHVYFFPRRLIDSNEIWWYSPYNTIVAEIGSVAWPSKKKALSKKSCVVVSFFCITFKKIIYTLCNIFN